MTPEALRILAASEAGYVASRVAVYREDGMVPPEAIRKLGTIADAVLAFLPGLGDMHDDATARAYERLLADVNSALRLAERPSLDIRMAVKMLLERAEHAEESLATARKALYEIGAMIGDVNARLDGSEPMATQSTQENDHEIQRRGESERGGTASGAYVHGSGGAGWSEAARKVQALGDEGHAQQDQRQQRQGGPEVPLQGATGRVHDEQLFPRREDQQSVAERRTLHWPEAGLMHGLVLINIKGERRLFGEPLKGQYSVQNVAPDGATAGEPWSTMPDAWAPEEWAEWAGLPIVAKPASSRYDAPIAPKEKAPKPPAADRTLSLFTDTPVSPAPTQKTIGDYAPDDAQFAKWFDALNKALATAGKESTTIEKVRDVFAAWKAAHATEEKPNPAATFWHSAKTSIVGN